MDLKKLQLNGMELVEPNAEYSSEQIFYLDFDGAKNASYDNEELNIHISGFDVADSGLDQPRINKIITELNTTFASTGVHFTVTPTDSSLLTPHSSLLTPHSSLLTPDSSLASTIYIGNAGSAFAQYGSFLGLSETIDAGNQIKTDNAFVFADKINSDATITETIAHEAGHLIGYAHAGREKTGTLADNMFTVIVKCSGEIDNNSNYSSPEINISISIPITYYSQEIPSNLYSRSRVFNKETNLWSSWSEVIEVNSSIFTTFAIPDSLMFSAWGDAIQYPGKYTFQCQVDDSASFSSLLGDATGEINVNSLLSSGDYYFRTKIVSPAQIATAWFTSSQYMTFINKHPDNASDSWQKAKDIADGIDNWVGFGDPADCYKIVMTKDGILSLNLTGLTGNADLYLLDNTGKEKNKSVNKANSAETITTDLLAGTYYVKVMLGQNVNNASYVLSHSVKYYPADKAENTWQKAKDIADGIDNWVGFGDPADCYKIVMTKDGTFSLNLTGLTGNADLYLLDNTGKEKKKSVNRANSAETIITDLLAGTYYVKVTPDKDVKSAEYVLSKTVNYFSNDTAGNTKDKAATLNHNSTITERVWSSDTVDYYELNLEQAGGVILILTNLSGAADISEPTFATKNKTNGVTSCIGLFKAGKYYIKITPDKGADGAYYTLKNVVTYFPGDTQDHAGNTSDKASKLDTSKVVDNKVSVLASGWVGFDDPADYYKLTMANTGTLTLNLFDLSDNADLMLNDANNNKLLSSANKGITNENIKKVLYAGDYYIKVTPAKDTDAYYKLNFAVNYFATDTKTEDKAGNTFETAGIISDVINNSPHLGWVGAGDKDDFFKFFWMGGGGGHRVLRLYDEKHDLIKTGDATLSLYDDKKKQLDIPKTKSGPIDGASVVDLGSIDCVWGKWYYLKVHSCSSANINYNISTGPLIGTTGLNLTTSSVKSGGLQLFSASSPLTGSSDSALGSDPLKKNQGMLAS